MYAILISRWIEFEIERRWDDYINMASSWLSPNNLVAVKGYQNQPLHLFLIERKQWWSLFIISIKSISLIVGSPYIIIKESDNKLEQTQNHYLPISLTRAYQIGHVNDKQSYKYFDQTNIFECIIEAAAKVLIHFRGTNLSQMGESDWSMKDVGDCFSSPVLRSDNSTQYFFTIAVIPAFTWNIPKNFPGHMRGPSPNAKYDIFLMWSMFSLENRLGSNISGCSKFSGSLWRRIFIINWYFNSIPACCLHVNVLDRNHNLRSWFDDQFLLRLAVLSIDFQTASAVSCKCRYRWVHAKGF